MKRSEDYISELLDSEIQTMKSAADSVAEIGTFRTQIEALLKPIEAFRDADSVVFYRYSNKITVQFWGADSIKEFEQLFLKFEELGIAQIEEWKCSFEGSTRLYAFKPESNALGIEIKISAKTCRLVQIGTKTIEQPIYEAVCDEEPAEEVTDDIPF